MSLSAFVMLLAMAIACLTAPTPGFAALINYEFDNGTALCYTMLPVDCFSASANGIEFIAGTFTYDSANDLAENISVKLSGSFTTSPITLTGGPPQQTGAGFMAFADPNDHNKLPIIDIMFDLVPPNVGMNPLKEGIHADLSSLTLFTDNIGSIGQPEPGFPDDVRGGATPVASPEPTSLALIGAELALFLLRRRTYLGARNAPGNRARLGFPAHLAENISGLFSRLNEFFPAIRENGSGLVPLQCLAG
jgi:hypothetical protein